MTKPDYTEIVVVQDRSGSMGIVVDDTINGFNHFLKEQKEQPGTCKLTLAQFDTYYELPINGMNIHDVRPLDRTTYIPRGTTALLDAIGKTINIVGNRLASMYEAARPAKIIFVIQTDGQENASNEFTNDKIKSMIEHQKEKYSWNFIFLGADQDAFAAAGSMGIAKGNTLSYNNTSNGNILLYECISDSVIRCRSSSVASTGGFFTPEEQAKALAIK